MISETTTLHNGYAGVLALGELLNKNAIRVDTEKNAQHDIEQVFNKANVPFSREEQLSSEDRPDFIVEGSIVVEVKIGGYTAKEIFRQLRRYAMHDKAQFIMLVTNKQINLPDRINNKSTFIINLGRGWL